MIQPIKVYNEDLPFAQAHAVNAFAQVQLAFPAGGRSVPALLRLQVRRDVFPIPNEINTHRFPTQPAKRRSFVSQANDF